MRKVLCVLVVLLTASSAFAQAPAAEKKAAQAKPATDAASVKKTIVEANARFLAALQKGDATAATAGYANDAIVMMPGAPAWKGHAAILEGMRGFLSEMTVSGGGAQTSDVMLAGNYAIETGTFEWTLAPKNSRSRTRGST